MKNKLRLLASMLLLALPVFVALVSRADFSWSP